MNNKKVFYTEFAYVFGLLFLSLGASLTEKAGFGMSMVIAPPYILYLKVSQYLSFFTFGMAAYVFQGFLIIITAIILRKVKLSYLFSFLTAVLYGFMLDGIGLLTEYIPSDWISIRVILFLVGICCSSFGVAFMFKTYLPPEAYELIVKEVSEKFKFPMHKVKLCYDISSLVFSIVLSFAFFGFGEFNGINVGTVITAFTNGILIGFFNKKLELIFVFKDKFKKNS